jgi:hypothetical protein
MKSRTARILTLLLILNLSSCTEFGPDRYHGLSSSRKFTFEEHHLLTYASDVSIEQFEVIRIVDGEYSDSRSGTCGKPRFDKYAYQAVHIMSIDSLRTDFNMVPLTSDDCGHFPSLSSGQLISFINTSFDFPNHDQVRWMDEFNGIIESKSNYHESITLRGDVFKNVFEYDVPNGKRLSRLYYTRAFGFVAFRLLDDTLFTLQI